MLSLQCPSGVLKCFKSVRSFPLAFRASLVSFDAFISASVFVAAFAFVISALFCVYGEIHSSSSEASQAELCWKASAGLFLVRLLVCKCIFQASICWRFFFCFFLHMSTVLSHVSSCHWPASCLSFILKGHLCPAAAACLYTLVIVFAPCIKPSSLVFPRAPFGVEYGAFQCGAITRVKTVSVSAISECDLKTQTSSSEL